MSGRALLAAICALAPAPTMAQDAAPLDVTLSQELAASPDAVWAVIGDFQDMSWHPVVFSTNGEGGNERDATRLLTLGEAEGPTIAERLTEHDDTGLRYAYEITEVAVDTLPVTEYVSELSVTPGAEGGAVVEWAGTFHRGDPGADPQPGLTDEDAVAAVEGVYRAGLEALAARFAEN